MASRGRFGLVGAAVALLVISACGSSKTKQKDSASGVSATTGSASGVSAASASAPLAPMLPSSIRKSGVLKIAVTNASPPEASVNASGKPVGMDVDFVDALGVLLGVKVHLFPVPQAQEIPGLQAGRDDLATAEFYVTAERLKAVDFVTDWSDYDSFLVRANGSFHPSKGADICGHKILVLSGSAEQATVQTVNATCKKKIVISAFPDQSSMFLALSSGRGDAAIAGGEEVDRAVSQSNGKLSASGHLDGGPCAIAVARNANSPQMLKAIQAGFNQLMKSGTYATILKKWNTEFGAVKSSSIYTANTPPPNYGP